MCMHKHREFRVILVHARIEVWCDWLSDWLNDTVTNCCKNLSCYSQLKISIVNIYDRFNRFFWRLLLHLLLDIIGQRLYVSDWLIDRSTIRESVTLNINVLQLQKIIFFSALQMLCYCYFLVANSNSSLYGGWSLSQSLTLVTLQMRMHQYDWILSTCLCAFSTRGFRTLFKLSDSLSYYPG